MLLYIDLLFLIRIFNWVNTTTNYNNDNNNSLNNKFLAFFNENKYLVLQNKVHFKTENKSPSIA